MTEHTWDVAKQVGDAGEAALDAHFGQQFIIQPATDAEQLQGIDRWFIAKVGRIGERFAVEYKTDTKAAETGRAYVEMFHVADSERPSLGWYYTSMSRWLIYYVPPHHEAIVLSFALLRQTVTAEDWQYKYRMGYVRNPRQRLDSYGLLVPLAALKAISKGVVQL